MIKISLVSRNCILLVCIMLQQPLTALAVWVACSLKRLHVFKTVHILCRCCFFNITTLLKMYYLSFVQRNGRNTLLKALMFFIPVMGILSSVLMVFLLTVNISQQLKQQIKLMGMSQGEYFNTLADGLVENRREQNRSSINKRQAAWNERLCPEKGPDLGKRATRNHI